MGSQIENSTMKHLILSLGSLFAVFPAIAQDGRPYLPEAARDGLVKHATLNVYDNVTDNCWTNSGTVESKARLAFEQNQVSVLDFKPAFYGPHVIFVEFDVFGSRAANGMCSVAAQFEVSTLVHGVVGGYDAVPEHSTSYIAVLATDAILLRNSGNTNEQVKDFYDGTISEYLAKVLAGRREETVSQFHVHYPDFGKTVVPRDE